MKPRLDDVSPAQPRRAPELPAGSGAPAPPIAGPLRTQATVVALSAFAIHLASPQKLGAVPFQSLIKDDLRLSPEAMAAFFGIAGAAWYVKPLAGALSDSVPLLGTRRRHYLLCSTLAAACLWAVMAAVPRGYYPLLLVAAGLNSMLVLGNTVVGGLVVDVGRRWGAIGRLSAVRVTAMNGASLVAGVAGGALATATFGVTCGASAALLLLTALGVGLFLREGSAPRPAERAPGAQLRTLASLLRSRALLSAMAITFLYYAVPSADTVIYYYRTQDLHLSNARVGQLDTLQCAGGMLGALAYAWLRRPFTLRRLLVAGLVCKLCGALLYLAYRSTTLAFALEGLIGFVTLLSVMPFQELAARAAPARHEALGLSIVLSVGNMAIALSRLSGASLFVRWRLSFPELISLQAATTAAVALFLPLIPWALLEAKDGEASTGAAR
ncbi:hypothetical protein BE21_19125 [Sorangium cellulosum]|uniref:MFS transporter n=1 Tax=Sorangium cellulosum TaxID=56 RepID=A0A150TX43_SORCE|nr:hypothetical protein BE21_19125 [Sorangium cellulosum]